MQLLDEMIEQQKKRMLSMAQKFVPHITPDDLLQPNDFRELENNPLFRYEEGILGGLQAAKAALLLKFAVDFREN